MLQETYPDDKAKGHFDTNQFSVRIMSSDFQSSSGWVRMHDENVWVEREKDVAYVCVDMSESMLLYYWVCVYVMVIICHSERMYM